MCGTQPAETISSATSVLAPLVDLACGLSPFLTLDLPLFINSQVKLLKLPFTTLPVC